MDTDEQIINLLTNMGRLVRKEIFMSKCMEDFPHSDMEVMFYLAENKGVTMKSLSDYLRIKPPSATPIINRLFNKNLLKRTPDKKDRRITCVSLTKKGVLLVEKKRSMAKHGIKKFFGKMSHANKKSLIKILKDVLKKYE